MTPAECFVELWKKAQNDLAKASTWGGQNNRGTVAYRVRAIDLDNGAYDWNEGMPTIRLDRPVTTIPPESRLELPDTDRSATVDACVLAHELGHFRSDRDGSRTQATYDAQRANQALTRGEKTLILEEERAAWRLGREELAALGCTEWAVFDATMIARL